MPKLLFDETGKRFWETGVSKGVLFPMSAVAGVYGPGVPWNGLINVTQSPKGAEASALYADNIKYLNLMSVEELEASIEAYTYPDEFAECDGSVDIGGAASGVKIGQQARKMFALAYQSKIGNDQNPDLGYKIHILYGCLAGPSEKSHDSVNDNPEAMTFSWDVTTTPVDIVGFKPTASIEIDSTKFVGAGPLAKLLEIETALYGGSEVGEDSELLMPQDIIDILEAV